MPAYHPEPLDTLPDDPTLDEVRAFLGPKLAGEAMFDGWTIKAVDNAAAMNGVDPAVARLAFDGGAMAMIDAWIMGIDAQMAKALPAETLAAMKVRERIRALVAFRLEAVAGEREAVRRALAIMAIPTNAARSLATGWRTVDLMWRLAGDTATDFNHYSKRTILAGVYAATLAVFVDDESDGQAETYAFLDRRIEGIMRFEKAKARLTGGERFDLARFLGRLRYPVR